jgi:hypothetical protein
MQMMAGLVPDKEDNIPDAGAIEISDSEEYHP